MAISPPFDLKNDDSNGGTIQIIGLYQGRGERRGRGQEVVGSNPASPSLGFLGGLVRFEVVSAGWWGSWVCQRAKGSLIGKFYLIS